MEAELADLQDEYDTALAQLDETAQLYQEKEQLCDTLQKKVDELEGKPAQAAPAVDTTEYE